MAARFVSSFARRRASSNGRSSNTFTGSDFENPGSQSRRKRRSAAFTSSLRSFVAAPIVLLSFPPHREAPTGNATALLIMKSLYLKPTVESAKPVAVKIGVEETSVIDAVAAAAKTARMERIKAAMNASARQRRREGVAAGSVS